MPAPHPSNYLGTLDKFLASWKNSNPEDTVALWLDDFEQRILPLSLVTPVKSRTVAKAVYPKFVKSLLNWQVSIFAFHEVGSMVW